MSIHKKKYSKPMVTIKKLEIEYEKCIICGITTNVPKLLPVEERCDYIPGAGQLCHECAIKNENEEREAMRSGFVYTLPFFRNRIF